MDLGKVFSSISQKVGKQDQPGEELLAIKISSTQVAAATWNVADEKVALGTVSQTALTSPEFEGLLAAADEVVSRTLAQDGNQEIRTEKVIFGVPFHWVTDGKIVPEKLTLLRKLCTELDLQPLGFVLLSEALENYYKETEGAPLTAILLEFDGRQGLLTMYRAGKSLGSLPVSGDLADLNTELEKALKQFTQAEVLPSRIIIYDGKEELEKIADKITAFPWTKTLPFLHFPRVETLPSADVVKAIAVAGGLQMGGHFEMTGSSESPESEQPEEIKPVPNTPVEVSADQESAAKEEPELEEVSAQEAGFLPETEFEEVEIPLTSAKEPTPSSHFGRLQEITTSAVETAPVNPSINPRETLTSAKRLVATFGRRVFGRISNFSSLPKALLAFSPAKSVGSSGKRFTRPVFLVLIILFIVLILAAVTIYSVPKATILLYVTSPNFDQELTVTVVTEQSTKPASNSATAISGSFINVSEIGAKKSVTTGKQLVGDKAKGSVTIYSATSGRTFTAGTTLTSPSGLKFTLDNNVSVASGDAITRATVTVTVTAADIGDTYNLPAGTKFTIGGLSTSQYAAQTDQSLAGGNSHQATVVTSQDQVRLLATLSAELTQKAQTDLEAKLSSGQQLLPNAITSTVSKKKFSADVGTEADTVSLDLTMDFSGVIFSQSDLVSVFAQNFPATIPAGFLLSPNKANLAIEDIKADKTGNAVLKTRLTAKLQPEINYSDTVAHLSGQSLSAAKIYLAKTPGFTSLSIETSPKIFAPIVQVILPWKKANISLEVVSQ